MDICQVMLAKGFGGAERLFVDLCRALAARGHRITAVCHARGEVARLMRGQAGITLETVRVAGAWDLLAVRRLRRLFAARRPAVIGAHLARATHLAGRAARPLGIPVIAKTHNYVDLRYYRHVDRFIATTVDQKDFLVRSGVASDRIEVVPNFSAIPPARDLAAPGGELAAVGRLVPKKGFDVLLRAMAELVQEGVDLRLRVGGDGPERERLLGLAQSLGLADRARFAGWQWDVAAFLEGASLFVLPSLDEPFGIVLIEAMARGVPIISTATQGPREILGEREGWLVAPGDAGALAAAIRAALRDPAESRLRAGRALAHFRAEFAEAAVLPKLIDIYARTAARS
jgi:glycosyltransferase involved in cell wall biosynthesis